MNKDIVLNIAFINITTRKDKACETLWYFIENKILLFKNMKPRRRTFINNRRIKGFENKSKILLLAELWLSKKTLQKAAEHSNELFKEIYCWSQIKILHSLWYFNFFYRLVFLNSWIFNSISIFMFICD